MILFDDLGEGATSKVTYAINKKENKIFALKFSSKLSDPTIFMREDFFMNKLNEISKKYPKVPFNTYRGIFKDPTKKETCYILELGAGLCTLQDLLKVGRKYKVNEALFVLKNLCLVCAILQENGIANRDIKPGNILFIAPCSKNRNFEYILADFGFACCLMKGESQLHRSFLSAFTKEFAAPEVCEIMNWKAGKQNLSKKYGYYNPFKSDVYSLGVVCLKMLGWEKSNLRKESHKSGLENLVIDLLNLMLEDDPSERPDFIELQKILLLEKSLKYSSVLSTALSEDAEFYRQVLEANLKRMRKSNNQLPNFMSVFFKVALSTLTSCLEDESNLSPQVFLANFDNIIHSFQLMSQDFGNSTFDETENVFGNLFNLMCDFGRNITKDRIGTVKSDPQKKKKKGDEGHKKMKNEILSKMINAGFALKDLFDENF